MAIKEVEQETERIKEIINRKFERDLKERKKLLKKCREKNHKRIKEGFSRLEKLQDDILFLIDNPNYKRKSKEE